MPPTTTGTPKLYRSRGAPQGEGLRLGRNRLVRLVHQLRADVRAPTRQRRRDLPLVDPDEVADAPVEELEGVVRGLLVPLDLVFVRGFGLFTSCHAKTISRRLVRKPLTAA